MLSTRLTTILSYYEGRYNMFEILRPKSTYYFDNIVTPSAFITIFVTFRQFKKSAVLKPVLNLSRFYF